MRRTIRYAFLALLPLLFAAGPASADKYDDTLAVFKGAGESAKYFDNSYGYALFPGIGKGGIGIGGAHGKGLVIVGEKAVGRSSLSQLTVGFQLGGQVYSQFIFFKDDVALQNFQRGNFEMGAQASAVAVTLGASADADYDKGVAVFTSVSGGLMYEATISGQKFSYDPL